MSSTAITGGDELPEQMRSAEGRRQALADARRRTEERKGRPVSQQPEPEVEVEVEPARSVSGKGGRREWFRVARHQLEEHRQREGRAIPRDREGRLFDAAQRFEANHQVHLAANEAYEHRRATERDKLGRALKGNSKPYTPPHAPEGDDQPVRSRLAGDAIQGPAAPPGLQRADSGD